MKKLVLDLNHCAGYGCMSYLEFGSDAAVIKFLEAFSMWFGCTKTYNNYFMYELPEESITLINTYRFKRWLKDIGVELVTSDDENFKEILKEEVFIQR